MDSKRFHCPLRSGVAMVLVLMAVAIAFVIGLTFLSTSTTTTDIAQTMDQQAQARQIAESGLAMAIRYIEQTSDWRTKRAGGTWFVNYSLYGGTVTVTGQFNSTSIMAPMALKDASFEQQVGALANTPLLSPPMTGTIGGWKADRTSMINNGATVPNIGVMASADASQGSQLAYITFTSVVQGSGQFNQTLSNSLQANTSYALIVDVGKTNLAPLLADRDLRIYAGNTLVVSSTDPSVFTAFTEAANPSVLTTVNLNATNTEYTVQFRTDDNPPAGPLRIELYAKSLIGLLSTVTFDGVRLEMETVKLTAVGRCGQASHVIAADVAKTGASNQVAIVRWSEP